MGVTAAVTLVVTVIVYSIILLIIIKIWRRFNKEKRSVDYSKVTVNENALNYC